MRFASGQLALETAELAGKLVNPIGQLAVFFRQLGHSRLSHIGPLRLSPQASMGLGRAGLYIA
jgi:hypothetical protein